MATTTTEQTEIVLNRHMQAIASGDLDAIVADYAPDCTFYTPDGCFTGQEAVRAFFAGMLETLPPDFMDAFALSCQECQGETAYIVWNAGNYAPLGTDTFIVRDDKIVMQSFAAYMPPPGA